MKKNINEITVLGAGLVGSLLSLFLRRKGYEVKLYEKRSDPRKSEAESGRSINLVLTSRGIKSLKKLNLDEEVLKMTVPVYGRMMHDQKGELSYQAYGQEGECNYSVDRALLNLFLINQAEKEGVQLKFNSDIKAIDWQAHTFKDEKEIHHFEYLIGAEGVASITRKELIKVNSGNENIEWLGVDYKEMHLNSSPSGDYLIEKNSLHIWPRGKHFLMALANLDGSFTMTLYLPQEGDISFQSINTDEKIISYFKEYYPDFIKICPDFLEQYKNNPVGKLGTVKCDPWHWQDKALLIGDAAHGITPFFGQGMNCGFEDCDHLDDILERFSRDFTQVGEEFFKERKTNADAIADMAVENYYEMSEKVADPDFVFKKKVENELVKKFPGKYNSRYRMVVFGNLPYRQAYDRGLSNEPLLKRIINNNRTFEDIDWDKAQLILCEKSE